MPEGPEAHTIARKLRDKITGMYIVETTIYDKADILSMSDMCLPLKIETVSAHGKRPVFKLDRGYIVCFLAMKGRWSFTRDNSSTFKMTLSTSPCTMFIVEDECIDIYYSGKGPAGHLKYLPTDDHLSAYFSSFGPDMLSSPPTEEDYLTRVRSLVTPTMFVAEFLLEQKYFSGVGNYLRADILYLCRLRPDRQMQSLSDADILNLYRYTRERMLLSYQHGGLTMKDYWDPHGERGVYPKIIYMTDYDPLGNPVRVDTIGKDRKIYWVPAVQS